MQLKLECILKLKLPELIAVDIAKDINILSVSDDISDEQFKAACDAVREQTKQKHLTSILELFEVELKTLR
jgi:hypothetical protein